MAGRFGVVAVGAVIAMTVGTARAADDPLGEHLWRSRVLVIAAADAGDARLGTQREALAAFGRGSAERDLVVIEAVGPDARAAALRRRLGIGTDAFRVVLVGKDGGAKLSASEPVPPQRLFAVIDAMPMRREETGRR